MEEVPQKKVVPWLVGIHSLRTVSASRAQYEQRVLLLVFAVRLPIHPKAMKGFEQEPRNRSGTRT